jgi:phosphate transport system substrate-binding protein
MMMRKIFLGVTALWLFTAGSVAGAETFTGAGSSAAAPLYSNWATAYEKATGSKLVYDPAGSSAGLRKIKAREVAFGATDVAPTRAELDKEGLAVFPTAISGIAPVVNLPKIADAKLKLNGTVLARIFMGGITQWNAPEIAQLNPGLQLPALSIKVIVRGDGSGTTYNFAEYLAKVSPDWQTQYGVKTTITWPSTFLVAKGSDGVAKAVRDTAGAISYIDFGFVIENQLTSVQMVNAAGEVVSPSRESFRQALVASEWVTTGNFTTTLSNMSARGAWPITTATFAVVPQVADKPQELLPSLRFFAWSFTKGDELVQQSSYVRLPTRVQAAAFKVIASVRDKSGMPIGLQATQF